MLQITDYLQRAMYPEQMHHSGEDDGQQKGELEYFKYLRNFTSSRNNKFTYVNVFIKFLQKGGEDCSETYKKLCSCLQQCLMEKCKEAKKKQNDC